ncbi:methyltransferase domain-containing protein [Rhodomicrobium lacus]|uniref:methyltransferase domain-containing protein n=1 Tax=Rhodomicrobium lacus TaxID=2498452 RepID=UPI000F8F4770|nr:methyltransferase domain-containing protein [Rhodomicrobium lacus]
MYDDVSHLRDFYASPLGQLARRIITHRVRARWDNLSGLDVVGLGYAAPYLRAFDGEARTTAALMPYRQGAVQWPSEGPFRAALVSETALPMRDKSVDCMLVVHGLEHVDARHDYLREIWRVLMPRGRLILVAPNRRGAWARFESTPFGHGRPYSLRQIEDLLRDALFEPVGVTPCLFAPPFRARHLPFAATAWERVGARLWPAFAGVLIVEAVKMAYAEVRVSVKKRAFASMPALNGLSPAHRRPGDGRKPRSPAFRGDSTGD